MIGRISKNNSRTSIIYCISVILAYFYNVSITFPFSVSEGTYVPEHRLKSYPIITVCNFHIFAFHYFLWLKKFYPIQVMAVMLFSLTIFGTLSFQLKGCGIEFLQLLFWFPVSLIYKAAKTDF